MSAELQAFTEHGLDLYREGLEQGRIEGEAALRHRIDQLLTKPLAEGQVLFVRQLLLDPPKGLDLPAAVAALEIGQETIRRNREAELAQARFEGWASRGVSNGNRGDRA